jgi:hypothetical protein
MANQRFVKVALVGISLLVLGLVLRLLRGQQRIERKSKEVIGVINSLEIQRRLRMREETLERLRG